MEVRGLLPVLVSIFILGVIGLSQNVEAQLTCVEPPPGMSSWWPADGTAEDIVGGQHGTMENGAQFTGGKVSEAFDLDGLNDVVRIENPSPLSGDFTIDMWVNHNFVRAGSVFNPGQIYISHDEGPGDNVPKWFLAHGDGNLFFHINGPDVPPDPSSGGFSGAGRHIAQTPFSPSPGQWYHLALTKAGSTYTFYINGQPGNPASDGTPIPSIDAPLEIGQGENAGEVSGLIDEVEIFGRALSQSEINAIYQADTAGKCKEDNDPPQIVPIDNQNVVADDVLEVSVSATDPEDDPIALSVSGPSFVSLTDNGNGIGSISISPSTDDEGEHSVTVTATDDKGNSSSEEFIITVETPVELVLEQLDDITRRANHEQGATLLFNDPKIVSGPIDGTVITCDPDLRSLDVPPVGFPEPDITPYPFGDTLVTCIAENNLLEISSEPMQFTITIIHDLKVEVTANKQIIKPQETVIYEVKVFNYGEIVVENVILPFFPPSMTLFGNLEGPGSFLGFVDFNGNPINEPSCQLKKRDFTCTPPFGIFGNGNFLYIEVAVNKKAKHDEVISLATQLTSSLDNKEANLDDNAITLFEPTVKLTADLTAEVTSSREQVYPNEKFEYTITIENLDDVKVPGVELNSDISGPGQVIKVKGKGCNIKSNNQGISCTFDMKKTQTRTFTVLVKVDDDAQNSEGFLNQVTLVNQVEDPTPQDPPPLLEPSVTTFFITSPNENELLSNPFVTVTGTGISGDTVEIELKKFNKKGKLKFLSFYPEVGSRIIGADGTWSIKIGSLTPGGVIALTSLDDGKYQVIAKVTSTSERNIKKVEDQSIFEIKAPLSITSPTENEILDNSFVTVTGTGFPGDNVMIKLEKFKKNGKLKLIDTYPPFGERTVRVDGTWSIKIGNLAPGGVIEFIDLDDGKYQVTVSRDGFAKKSSDSDYISRIFEINASSP